MIDEKGAHLLDPGYYNETHLAELGFRSLGTNVMIARDSIIVGIPNVAIGSNVRIDSNVTFAAISGSLTIGDYVHIGGGSHINCTGGVSIGSYVAISQGVKIYSASDDYSGIFMTNPTVPRHLRRDQVGEINIGDHVIIGSGSVVLPGVDLEMGAAIGALSLVKSNVAEFTLVAGSPAKYVRDRSRNVLSLSQELLPGI